LIKVRHKNILSRFLSLWLAIYPNIRFSTAYSKKWQCSKC